MTPVASWSPQDYYTASRHARRAWLATQPQLVMEGVLDAADTGTPLPGSVGSIERVPNPTSPLPRGRARKSNTREET